MKIKTWEVNQIGLMITWGYNWEKRKYVCLDIPFLAIQILAKKNNMKIAHIEKLEMDIVQNEDQGKIISIISSVMQLLHESKEVLFADNGNYRKLKWHHFGRIWKIAKIAIRLINTLLAIFNNGRKDIKIEH